MITIKPNEFVEKFFRIDNGKRFSFKGRDYLLPIYNNTESNLLIMSSRQAEKSTYLANTMLLRAFLKKMSSALYVTARKSQADDFVRLRVDPQFEMLPGLKNMYLSNKKTNRISDKILSNGVSLFFRSLGISATAIRGISAQEIYFDEVQSIYSDNIPIALECAHSFTDRARYRFAGTPLSTKNHFSRLWDSSCQNEWIIYCTKCKQYDEPLGINHIDQKKPFLFCSNCGKPLDRNYGEWVAQNPSSSANAYRISRLMTPNCRWTTPAGDGILDKFKTYSTTLFHNEVLGLPYDSGSFAILPEEIYGWCTENEFIDPNNIPNGLSGTAQIMGVDWAWENPGGEHSHTMITIATKFQERIKIIYAKRFDSPRYHNPDTVLKEMASLAQSFSVQIIGTDWGIGHKENIRLRNMVKPEVHEFMYTGSTKPLIWDYESYCYKIGKTPTMSRTFELIRNGTFEFPKIPTLQPFASDILSIFSEMDSVSKIRKYDHIGPDDFFHTLNYIVQVYKLLAI